MTGRITKPVTARRRQLSREEFNVARGKGKEMAYSGHYCDNHTKGIYRCVCCGQGLFDSETKDESGTGWPSIYQPIAPENIEQEKDTTFSMIRNEVVCSRCEAHLGHVFDDRPQPTGLRYCINSVSLTVVLNEQVI